MAALSESLKCLPEQETPSAGTAPIQQVHRAPVNHHTRTSYSFPVETP